MGCGDTKTKEEEPKKDLNINEELNNNENSNIQNNNNIEKRKEEEELVKKFKNEEKKEKKIKVKKIENDIKINGQITNISLKENQKLRNFEDYNEGSETGEEKEEKEENEEEIKEKENIERKQFLVNLKFRNIFKEDNIDKSNSTIFIDTTQKVKTTFIPSQKKFPKVTKYPDPVQGVDGPFWEFDLEASKYETMCPLWMEKDKEIIFYLSGKWNINDELECNWNGISEPKNNYEEYMPNLIKDKFNKGALVGRTIYGEEFLIYYGLRYKNPCNGPLILRMYLNGLFVKDHPSGSLNIKIKGAIYVRNVFDMEDRIGWWKQLKVIEFNNLKDLPDYKIPSLEKMIIILFNKARFNSKLFACQYLDNMKYLTPNSIKIYNEFVNNPNQNLPFKINVSIVKFLQDFYAPFLSGNNDNSKESLIILKSRKIIKNFLNKCFNGKKNIFHISIIKYKYKNQFHLASRLIFENEIRKNIFDSKCEEMSMMTIKANEGYKKEIFYSIIVLSDEKGNDDINYDISKNIKNFINEEKKMDNEHNIISMVKINLNPLPNIFSQQKNSNFYNFN